MRLFYILILGLGLFTTGISQAKRPIVLSTASIFNDMAQQIGGDHFSYDMIVPIGGDPHIYDPIPNDVQKCVSADLILKNGLTFEGWLAELIENSGTKSRQVLITQGIKPIQALTQHNSTDPHAWMDAHNGLMYAKNIRNALVALMPSDSQDIELRYQAYKSSLEQLDEYIKLKIQSIPPEKRILITSHDAFQYYGQRYGIRLEAVLGITTDADVQTGDILRLNKVIKENKIPAVFLESTINGKLLEQVAADNHIVIGGKLYSDSIGDSTSPAPSYYAMLKHNTDVITTALLRENTTSHQSTTRANPWYYWIAGLVLLAALVYFIISKVGQSKS